MIKQCLNSKHKYSDNCLDCILNQIRSNDAKFAKAINNIIKNNGNSESIDRNLLYIELYHSRYRVGLLFRNVE